MNGTGASRTPGATVPAELQRQADRIGEQSAKLALMLSSISINLEGMSGIMGKYDEDLQTEINHLKDAVDDYNSYVTGNSGLCSKIQGQITSYLADLLTNLSKLRESVESIRGAVEQLYK